MHEIGVLDKAIKQIRNVASENGIASIKGVTFQVGEASGYLTRFFEEYFPIMTEGDPLFADCKLNILVTKAEAICLDCHSLYNVMAQKGKCPKCGSREKQMIGGQEFLVKDLTY